MERCSLSKSVQKELFHLYHNYELLQSITQVHRTRFDFSAAVISEDWDSVQSCIGDILVKLGTSYLLFYYSSHFPPGNDDIHQCDANGQDASQRSQEAEQEDRPSCQPMVIFYGRDEMITKASFILQHIEQQLANIAVQAIGNLQLLSMLQATIAVRQTLQKIVDYELTLDRDKFQLPLAINQLYVQRTGEHVRNNFSGETSFGPYPNKPTHPMGCSIIQQAAAARPSEEQAKKVRRLTPPSSGSASSDSSFSSNAGSCRSHQQKVSHY